MKSISTFQLTALTAMALAFLAMAPSSSQALDRASPGDAGIGISLSAYTPSITGSFSQALSGQIGGSVALDTSASWLSPRARLFASFGMQTYDVLKDSYLTLNTFDGFVGVHLSSEPFLWVIEPTLGLGVGGTSGTLQIAGTSSETQNSSLWFSTLVNPGVSFRIGAGFSAGVELPIRFVFATDRLTTWSPALTLRYAL